MNKTQILRQMQLVRSQIKDKELQAELLAPLQDQLIAIMKEEKAQGKLPLDTASEKKPGQK